MDQPVTMPQLGESVTEGTITRWLKAEEDEVALDEPLAEVGYRQGQRRATFAGRW
ncbi:MAG: hypothetical protein M3P37_04935 [Actinomycetota bacterium]|nr:hypothetical protein [Actinomycetota bacterium]